MEKIWKIALNDFKFMVKQREAQLWMFLMPLGFCAFFGFAFSERPHGTAKPKIGFAAADTGFAVEAFKVALESMSYEVVGVESEDELAGFSRHVLVPEGFTERLVQGIESDVVFRYDLGDLQGRYDEVKVNRALWKLIGATAAAASKDSLNREGLLDAVRAENPYKLEVSQSGRSKVLPMGFSQAIPGNLVMFVLLIAFTSGAVQLVVERDEGLLRRLASSPLSGGQLLTGKAVSRVMIAAMEVAYFLILGAYVFKIDWGDNHAALLLVLLGYCVGAAGLGLLMGSLGRSPDQAAGIGVFSALVMSALGGAWWPLEIVPSGIRWVAFVFPTGWAMDGILKAMTLGQTAAAIAPNAVALFLYGIVSIAVAARIFRFS